jgi:predicted transcriptional regulator
MFYIRTLKIFDDIQSIVTTHTYVHMKNEEYSYLDLRDRTRYEEISSGSASSDSIGTNFGGRYRDRFNIIHQILEAANGGATKTRMMYKAGLNHNGLKGHLMVIVESDLLRYDRQTHSFKTTEKGLQFLDKYHRIVAMIKEEQSTPSLQQQMRIQREQ